VSGATIINHTFYTAQLQVLTDKRNVVHAHLSIKSHHHGCNKNKNKNDDNDDSSGDKDDDDNNDAAATTSTTTTTTTTTNRDQFKIQGLHQSNTSYLF